MNHLGFQVKVLAKPSHDSAGCECVNVFRDICDSGKGHVALTLEFESSGTSGIRVLQKNSFNSAKLKPRSKDWFNLERHCFDEFSGRAFTNGNRRMSQKYVCIYKVYFMNSMSTRKIQKSYLQRIDGSLTNARFRHTYIHITSHHPGSSPSHSSRARI